jgi:hypothetical protein
MVMMGSTVTLTIQAVAFFYLLGRYFGLAAYFILLFQYMWTAKIHFIERLMSFDRRISFHRALGFGSFLFLHIIAGSTFLGRIWGVRYEIGKFVHKGVKWAKSYELLYVKEESRAFILSS